MSETESPLTLRRAERAAEAEVLAEEDEDVPRRTDWFSAAIPTADRSPFKQKGPKIGMG